ncbi:MAG: molecular chaperone DnaJ, partial [Epsilonproteobacteria bacterium]|nr:molecular chaperone DnaJ [Campylobacterota bacterium]
HFIRDGINLYIEVPIFFTQAILGGTIKIPSIDGEIELKIPPNTKDKEQFILREKGVVDVHNPNHRGDLIIQVNIVYPQKITPEQKELLLKLQNSFGVESEPHKGILESAIERFKKWIKKPKKE